MFDVLKRDICDAEKPPAKTNLRAKLALGPSGYRGILEHHKKPALEYGCLHATSMRCHGPMQVSCAQGNLGLWPQPTNHIASLGLSLALGNLRDHDEE
ncbi:hypothetical protein N7540_000466 [Penicillium herquei]|nr:hypothetical protein N7540_000466 [Penicillium herquei]